MKKSFIISGPDQATKLHKQMTKQMTIAMNGGKKG